jgi:hypothetical protein
LFDFESGVARSEAAKRGDKQRDTVIIQYSAARRRRRSPLNAADRAVSRYERVQQLRAADRATPLARRSPRDAALRSALCVRSDVSIYKSDFELSIIFMSLNSISIFSILVCVVT